MITIPYTDTCILVPPTTIDPDTGDNLLGQEITSKCRFNYSSQLVRAYNGDMVVAMAKIYIPADSEITSHYKIKVDEKLKDILKLEEKKDLSGRVNHYVVYI